MNRRRQRCSFFCARLSTKSETYCNVYADMTQVPKQMFFLCWISAVHAHARAMRELVPGLRCDFRLELARRRGLQDREWEKKGTEEHWSLRCFEQVCNNSQSLMSSVAEVSPVTAVVVGALARPAERRHRLVLVPYGPCLSAPSVGTQMSKLASGASCM